MIKAIIFDLDGTLADTMGDLQSAMNRMLRHYGYPERTREELACFINKGARYFVWKSLPDGVADSPDCPAVDQAMKIYSEGYEKCYLDKTREYEGITAMLNGFKEQGIKTAVLSNKPDRFVKDICNKLFPDMFLCAVGQGQFPTKPDPTAALAIAEELGVLADECAFVGDSDVDMITAANAKMLPVGVSWGYRDEDCLMSAGAKLMAHNSKELCSLLDC